MAELKSNIDNQDLLSFVLDDKMYAFPILCLRGVIGNPSIVSIINAPNFVNGLIYIDNQFIPILDLKLILNRPNLTNQNEICVIIVRVSFRGEKKLVGFIVNSSLNTLNVQKKDIKKLPTIENEEFIDGLIDIKNKIVLLLDLEKIINENRLISFLNQFWNLNNQNSEIEAYRRNKNGA